MVLIKPVAPDATLDEIAQIFGEDYDIILTEGFKQGSAPKIEVHRRETGPPLSDIKKLIAIATDEPLETETRQFSLDDVKGSWQDIISNLSKIKMSVATYLSEGAPIQLEANNLTVSFPKNYALHKEALERKENKLIIEKTTTDLLKTNVRLNFVLSNEEAHKDKSDTSPLMKTILDTFKARTIKE